MKYLWAVATHTGRVRANNQDTPHPATSGSSDDGPVLVGVADGMGGAAGGEVASSVAMTTATDAAGTPADRIEAANEAVFEESRRRPELAGMGTTMTLIALDDAGQGLFGHVGDSRAYLARDGEIRQLTTDHTIVAEWVALGAITPEDAKTHPRRGMLTRSVGVSPGVEVDVFTHDFRDGDRLILCSDGLNGMIDDDAILSIGGEGTPEAAAWALVEAANDAGGYDNITVVVVDLAS
ncbi:MAG: serine/threonine-protein phosphatase [Acidimicrobiia bacterium]|nr:serine/threonine-protein phosphatase [Acidimicrobiia bacterium]